jgi:hypothetical protein
MFVLLVLVALQCADMRLIRALRQRRVLVIIVRKSSQRSAFSTLSLMSHLEHRHETVLYVFSLCFVSPT